MAPSPVKSSVIGHRSSGGVTIAWGSGGDIEQFATSLGFLQLGFGTSPGMWIGGKRFPASGSNASMETPEGPSGRVATDKSPIR